jgi:tetratricopeptide (TPR) repeat protein
MGHMNDANFDETRPSPMDDETNSTETGAETSPNLVEASAVADPANVESPANTPESSGEDPTGGSPAWRWLIVLSLFALVVIATASVIGGYRAGINQRTQLESTQVAQTVQEQFNQGVQDMQAGRYEIARQRFEYVIRLNPNYPGVTDKLADVLLEINTTVTPTTIATPTLTPTEDLRGAEELFSQAQTYLADQKWSEAIDTLLVLRKNEPSYRVVEVDSMLFVALRYRGVDKILNKADLEGGTYDLALAERFGPLDVEASNYRQWADLYAKGASFWELDWSQAVFYFGQLIVPAPNLRDSAGMTATERYRIALIKYGDQLAEAREWCLAQEQYAAAFNVASDPQVEPTAAWVTQKCENESREAEAGDQPTEPPAQASPTPGEAVSPTPGGEASPTPGQVTLTPGQAATPTPEPTQGPTQEPTQEPTQAPTSEPTQQP